MSQRPSILIEQENGEPVAIPISAGNGGSPLTSILADHGFPLNTRCGERGLCRGCEVELKEGRVILEGEEVSAPALVRACQAVAHAAVRLKIPSRSRIEHRPHVSDTFEVDVPCSLQPLFEPRTGGPDTAFAIDVGTTTVAVLLVDLTTGEAIGRAGGFNEQIRYGDNVLTRIEAASQPGVLQAMQRSVVAETIAPLLLRACDRAGREPSRLIGGAISGNTTMLHLLTGEDPGSLGIAPFTARFLEGRKLEASEIGLHVAANGNAMLEDAPVYLLPGIAAYIGADITAGVYATGMIYDTGPSLFIDIGTNGEIVLQSGGSLTACATAAGPAFEGAGLQCGTRARAGAISAISLSVSPMKIACETIGGGSPVRADGICGSAYLDFLAGGRQCGLLLPSGRFDPGFRADLPDNLKSESEWGKSLRINGTHQGALAIGEADIAVLLQAKAAIAAGIETLLMAANVEPSELSRVYLAGGFGMHLNVKHAIACGLLPGFRSEQVRVVGNTALAGSLLAVLDKSALVEMETLRERVDVLELNLQENFEDSFIDHLELP